MSKFGSPLLTSTTCRQIILVLCRRHRPRKLPTKKGSSLFAVGRIAGQNSPARGESAYLAPKSAVEMTGGRKRGKPKPGFHSLPTALGNRSKVRFPHSIRRGRRCCRFPVQTRTGTPHTPRSLDSSRPRNSNRRTLPLRSIRPYPHQTARRRKSSSRLFCNRPDGTRLFHPRNQRCFQP